MGAGSGQGDRENFSWNKWAELGIKAKQDPDAVRQEVEALGARSSGATTEAKPNGKQLPARVKAALKALGIYIEA